MDIYIAYEVNANGDSIAPIFFTSILAITLLVKDQLLFEASIVIFIEQEAIIH